jgi:uncharacterized membrane protein YdjX (TVP38/TMEM64 family)
MTRFIFRGLLVIVLLVLLAWFVQDVLDKDRVDALVGERGVTGMLLFVSVCVLLGSIGLSRQVIAFLGGYAFGFSNGFILSMLAVVGACITTYTLSRGVLQRFLSGRLPARVQRIDRFLHDNTFSMAMLLRLLPLGSNWVINIAAGASSVRVVPFLLGSALGYIPQMVIFSLVGSGTRVSQFWQVAIAMALFVVAAVIGMALYRSVLRGRRLDAALDRDPGVKSTSAVTQE